MKSKWIIAGILIVALIGLCGTSLFSVWQGVMMAQENDLRFDIGPNSVSAKSTETKDLSVSGPVVNLTVELDFGEISVKSGSDGKVNIQAEKTAWGSNDADAQSALQDLKVVIEQDGNSIRISVQRPTEVGVLKFHREIGTVKFTITVPRETAVTLNSSNADLSLAGTNGDADLQTDFGGVELRDVDGSVYIRTSNGPVNVTDLDSEEAITLESDFGTITVDHLTGADVTVTSSNGKIDLSNLDISDGLKAGSQFGGIRIHNGSAHTVEVQSTNGGVILEDLDVNGLVSVRSDFGDLTVTGVDAGGFDLATENGKIRLDGATGKIKAHSNFGTVEVLNAPEATIDLSSNNGGVTFSGSLGAGPHVLSSEFGNIELTLPAASALDADFQTDFGKITSDFGVTLVLQGEVDSRHLQGEINGGGEKLTVKTNNGNIIIHSSD